MWFSSQRNKGIKDQYLNMADVMENLVGWLYRTLFIERVYEKQRLYNSVDGP